MYGHLVRERTPAILFDEDYLYGSIFGQLLQENLATQLYARSSTLIDSSPDQQAVMGAGQGGRHRPALNATGRTVYVGTLVLVAWGVLAFGSPYPWAYVPLATCSALVGLLAWFGTGPPGRLLPDQKRLLIAFGVLKVMLS